MRQRRSQASPIVSFFTSKLQRIIIGLALGTLSLGLVTPLDLHPVQAQATNTWTVNVLTDSGLTTCVANAGAGGSSCELRDAMNKATSGDTINFSVSGTITLGSTLPTISTTLTIDGTGQSVTISGGNNVEIFDVVSSGNLTLKDLTIANGKVGGYGGGGGIYNNNGTVMIQSSTFSGNSAFAGGGAENTDGTMMIQNSLFVGNYSPNYFGGGLYNVRGTVIIQNSTFSGNSAAHGGGGLYNANGTVMIENSTFSGNGAPSGSGGGVYTVTYSGTSSTVTIENSTFAGNSAIVTGGVYEDVGGMLNLGSSIFAENTNSGGSAPDIFTGGKITTLGHNLVGDGSYSGLTDGMNGDQVGTSANPINPQLSALGSYGGSTQTMLLLPGSPAIGKGNCNLPSPATSVTTDQRGVARKVIGVGCDVGAFEDFAFSPSSLPNAIKATAYSQTITPSNGTPPYTFNTTLLSGSLPTGISMNSGGTLQGTTTQTGSFPFTFQVIDNRGDITQWGYKFLVTFQPDTIGVYRQGAFLLRNSNSTGYADIAFNFLYGSKPYPVVGNWMIGGSDTAGLIDESNAQFFLRNANAAGSPDEQFVLGIANDEPIAGQWKVSGGHDGVGVFRPSNGLLLLKNALSTGYADYAMVLGIPGDQGLAGDWSGQSYDSPGVYRPSSQLFLLSNKVCNCSVYADYALQLGNPGDNPLTGDWVAQGHAGAGVFRPTSGLILLKNQLATGYADIVIVYGIPNDVPIAGHWIANVPAVVVPPNVLVPPTSAPIGTVVPGNSNLGG